jgi:hypothetical protein
MDSIARLRLLEKLRDLCGQISVLSKETSSTPVAGLGLVREDLAGRRNQHTVHGQKQKQPINSNKITPPTGMGTCSDSPNVGSYYQAGPNQ